MVAGREHVCSGVELKKAAGVAEDDGVEHDVFIGAAREIDVWCLDSDTSGKGHWGPGAEGRFENGWATCVVRGDQRVEGRGVRTRTRRRRCGARLCQARRAAGTPLLSRSGGFSRHRREVHGIRDGWVGRLGRVSFRSGRVREELGFGLEQVLSVH